MEKFRDTLENCKKPQKFTPANLSMFAIYCRVMFQGYKSEINH